MSEPVSKNQMTDETTALLEGIAEQIAEALRDTPKLFDPYRDTISEALADSGIGEVIDAATEAA